MPLRRNYAARGVLRLTLRRRKMFDFTSTSVSFPIPHNPNDKRPLPEIIADHCGFPLARREIDSIRYYAVQDWLRGIAQIDDARKFWYDIKRRLKKAGVEMSVLCRRLPYKASDGKNYPRDYADAETLYRITQRMDANTGIREAVLQFLARAGVVVDEFRIDPEKALEAVIEAYKRQGKSIEWIEIRIRTKIGRLIFTASFQRSLRTSPPRQYYAIITDELRLGLWRRRTRALREQLGLREKDSLRDHMSRIALYYEGLAESISAHELDQHSNLEFTEAKVIVPTNSESVGRHAEETGRRLRIDIPTGRPILPDKTQNPTDNK
jgi:hypothetical protein